MTNWNASNYRQRKAARLTLVKPEWIINPETGEQFYLRKVGGLMSSVLAGYMPAGLTSVAVEAWKESGVQGMALDDMTALAATLTPEQQEAGVNETKTISLIIQQMCVIPLLSNNAPGEAEFTKEWREAAIRGLKEKDPHFDETKFDPKDIVFNPQELDENDTVFLFKWAKGLAGGVSLKGGNVTGIKDVERFRKRLARGARVKPNSAKVRDTA